MLAAGQVLIILSGTDMSAPWLLWTGAAMSGIGLAPIFGSVFALFAQYGMPPPGRVVGLMLCLTNAGDIAAQNIASVRKRRKSFSATTCEAVTQPQLPWSSSSRIIAMC